MHGYYIIEINFSSFYLLETMNGAMTPLLIGAVL